MTEVGERAGPTSLKGKRTVVRCGSVLPADGALCLSDYWRQQPMFSRWKESTAFPQPAPGTAPLPGPIRDVPAGKLRSLLGSSDITYISNNRPLRLSTRRSHERTCRRVS